MKSGRTSTAMKSTGKRTSPPFSDDRVVKEIPPLPRKPLATNKLFTANGIDLDALRAHFQAEGRLSKPDALRLIEQAANLYRAEPNLLHLQDPITVCGDIHGQFFDLLRVLEAGGPPSSNRYLFLGDYVDRGCFSTECVFFLFAHKITYNHQFWMIRGNHECRCLTDFFNFKDECIYKYDIDIYDAIMNAFDCLPLAAVLNDKFFACHGGLGPDLTSLDQINEIDRFCEVPKEGIFCDLLWADPADPKKDEKRIAEKKVSEDEIEKMTWFQFNSTRQCSFFYGVDAVTTFLNAHNLSGMIRAHEACYDGYKFLFVSKETRTPRVITIFSAPNYCDVYKNKGAVLKIDASVLNIRQYVCSPHPYYLPNFMDVFTWSIPFVAEKVCKILHGVLAYATGADGSSTKGRITADRKNVIRKKIHAVSRMVSICSALRTNQEGIVKLKALSPSRKAPCGVLHEGKEAILKAVSNFESAKEADFMNECMPGTEQGPRLESDLQFGFAKGPTGWQNAEKGLLEDIDET